MCINPFHSTAAVVQACWERISLACDPSVTEVNSDTHHTSCGEILAPGVVGSIIGTDDDHTTAMDINKTWERSRDSSRSIYVQFDIVVIYSFDSFRRFFNPDIGVAWSIKWDGLEDVIRCLVLLKTCNMRS